MSPPDAHQVPPYVYLKWRRPHVYEALPPPLKWDASIWFYDGDVTLVVQGIAFRLHITMLANWSEVLESWFIGPCATIPHTHNLGFFDGRPLVALRAVDTAHDLREALLLMYGIMRIESVTKYSIAAALHRVALAYRMPTIVDAVHKLLDHVFPATIDEWDNRPAERVSFDLGKAQAIEAYNVCKLADDRHIFAAIYYCAQLPKAVLREGTHRLDRTPERLAEDDVRLLLKAKALLKRLGAKALREARKIRAVGGADCVKVRCRKAFEKGILPDGEDASALAQGQIVSGWADRQIARAQRWETICARCAAHAREAHLKIRESLWEEFTESVELPEPVGGPFEDRASAEMGDDLRAVPGARENSALGNP